MTATTRRPTFARTALLAALALCVGLPALAETITGFTKPTIKGMKDGTVAMLAASDFTFPIQDARRVGPALEFDHAGQTYKVRLADVDTGDERVATCLPGEEKVASASQSIGGTQMGSGQSGCVKPD
jgi:endonuclease YncB( thermonuclease family)